MREDLNGTPQREESRKFFADEAVCFDLFHGYAPFEAAQNDGVMTKKIDHKRPQLRGYLCWKCAKQEFIFAPGSAARCGHETKFGGLYYCGRCSIKLRACRGCGIIIDGPSPGRRSGGAIRFPVRPPPRRYPTR